MADLREEGGQLRLIQVPPGSHSRAYIDAIRLDCANRLRHVVRSESTCQEQRYLQGLTNRAADSPIVCSTGTTELFDRR